MKVYVVRHGETTENITGILQGNMDTILNETGKNQAREIKKAIDNINVDVIISSPLKRAYETATIINDGKLDIITDERLKSRNHGEFEGMSLEQIDFNSYWNYNQNIKYEKAENVRDLYKRLELFMEELKENYKNKDVLLVTHSGVCRILYFYFNGLPEDGNFRRYKSSNCSFEEYELKEDI